MPHSGFREVGLFLSKSPVQNIFPVQSYRDPLDADPLPYDAEEERSQMRSLPHAA
jgi:hypothetical protein